MGLTIRSSGAEDAEKWLELVQATIGPNYPDPKVHDPEWIASQLQSKNGNETWVAEENGHFLASLTLLPPSIETNNPVANLGRHLNLPLAYETGTASQLLQHVLKVTSERKQLIISRVLSSDKAMQDLYEQAGFVCVGFQPLKHVYQQREGVLFYFKSGGHDVSNRLPLSESLPQVGELCAHVLRQLQLPNQTLHRDGTTGYPVQSDITVELVGPEAYEPAAREARQAGAPDEISGSAHQGSGYFRNATETTLYRLLGSRGGAVVAGASYAFDPVDKCVRLIDGFSVDDLSMGAMVNHVLKTAQEKLNAVYVELDILTTSPRLLKSAEQLGFVPVAFMPSIYHKAGAFTDLVKMVKLNMVYSSDKPVSSAGASAVVALVDDYFQDQKTGVAIINLLRTLPFFEGLGDGELRKISRLFTQKLFMPGDPIFKRGDQGHEAYVIMRGQVDIRIDETSPPIVTFGNGQIFGELAFLDGSPRTAMAVANQPSILLMIQRSEFSKLVQREPHLGMVVMRNIALELSSRLRKTNAAISPQR